MFKYNGIRAGLIDTIRNILIFRKVDRKIRQEYPAHLKTAGPEYTSLDMSGDFV